MGTTIERLGEELAETWLRIHALDARDATNSHDLVQSRRDAHASNLLDARLRALEEAIATIEPITVTDALILAIVARDNAHAIADHRNDDAPEYRLDRSRRTSDAIVRALERAAGISAQELGLGDYFEADNVHEPAGRGGVARAA